MSSRPISGVLLHFGEAVLSQINAGLAEFRAGSMSLLMAIGQTRLRGVNKCSGNISNSMLPERFLYCKNFAALE